MGIFDFIFGKKKNPITPSRSYDWPSPTSPSYTSSRANNTTSSINYPIDGLVKRSIELKGLWEKQESPL